MSSLLNGFDDMPMKEEGFYRELYEQIEAASQILKEGEQLSIQYQTRAGGVLQVTRWGYRDPNLIVLFGTIHNKPGREVSVMAHAATIELILEAVKGGPQESRRVGFLGNLAKRDEG